MPHGKSIVAADPFVATASHLLTDWGVDYVTGAWVYIIDHWSANSIAT